MVRKGEWVSCALVPAARGNCVSPSTRVSEVIEDMPMSQSGYADAVPSGTVPAQRKAGSALALRNWRLACRLIVLAAIPAMLGLSLAGLRLADTIRGGQAYGRIGQVAALGQRVTGLVQAMEDERAATGVFIADGRPAAGLATLNRQYVITDRRAATVRRFVLGLDGNSARTRPSMATILSDVAKVPGLRRTATQSQAPALAVINGYSAVIGKLLAVNGGIASLSGNVALITSARTVDSLSRMEDHASLQRAILDAALAAGHFGPGALTALSTAEAQQASDLASFRSSATQEQNWALTSTLAEPLADQARTAERRAIAAGNGAFSLGSAAAEQWAAGMSFTVGWMRHAEQHLADWMVAYAQDMRRSATRSATITAGLVLAAMLLVVVATVIISRSVVRPLRRLEAAALAAAEEDLPARVRALGVAGNPRPLPSLAPTDVQSADEIGRLARAVDQVHSEAVRLAGDEARKRGSLNAIIVAFLRRNSSLVESLLRLIDRFELDEADPERLNALFQMDHLATRMRRISDSALALAGDRAPRRWTGPVTMVDLLRAAVSETEQYGRVALDVEPTVSPTASAAVTATAAIDIVHMLAELLENATAFSPAMTQVSMSGRTARDGGWLVSIADRGMGMPEEQLWQLNEQLARPPLADAAADGHMGLFAVAHLAARHGIRVAIAQPPGGGTTVQVHIPATLISRAARPVGRAGVAGEISRARIGERSTDPEPVRGTDAMRHSAPLLGAPLPSLTPPHLLAEVMPELAASEQEGLPIFESVESEYLGAGSANRLGLSDAEACAPAQDSRSAEFVPGATVHRSAAAAVSAQIARTRLTSFQQGSRRARAETQTAREAKRTWEDSEGARGSGLS
jgi:signal transduction histidine kinase